MKNIFIKFLKQFLIIFIIIPASIIPGSVLKYAGIISIRPAEICILASAFALNSAVALAIFLTGRVREGKEGAMFSMVAISLKFLIEMLIALLWFTAAKKTELEYILLFFVLYLTFSLCLILIILNILNNKSL